MFLREAVVTFNIVTALAIVITLPPEDEGEEVFSENEEGEDDCTSSEGEEDCTSSEGSKVGCNGSTDGLTVSL